MRELEEAQKLAYNDFLDVTNDYFYSQLIKWIVTIGIIRMNQPTLLPSNSKTENLLSEPLPSSITMSNTTSSSLMLLLFFIVLVQSTHLLQGSHSHVSSFIHPTRSLASFVDNNSKTYSMSSSSEVQVMSDADAYHEMVAAAVDLTNAHVTNGMLSG